MSSGDDAIGFSQANDKWGVGSTGTVFHLTRGSAEDEPIRLVARDGGDGSTLWTDSLSISEGERDCRVSSVNGQVWVACAPRPSEIRTFVYSESGEALATLEDFVFLQHFELDGTTYVLGGRRDGDAAVVQTIRAYDADVGTIEIFDYQEDLTFSGLQQRGFEALGDVGIVTRPGAAVSASASTRVAVVNFDGSVQYEVDDSQIPGGEAGGISVAGATLWATRTCTGPSIARECELVFFDGTAADPGAGELEPVFTLSNPPVSTASLGGNTFMGTYTESCTAATCGEDLGENGGLVTFGDDGTPIAAASYSSGDNDRSPSGGSAVVDGSRLYVPETLRVANSTRSSIAGTAIYEVID